MTRRSVRPQPGKATPPNDQSWRRACRHCPGTAMQGSSASAWFKVTLSAGTKVRLPIPNGPKGPPRLTDGQLQASVDNGGEAFLTADDRPNEEVHRELADAGAQAAVEAATESRQRRQQSRKATPISTTQKPPTLPPSPMPGQLQPSSLRRKLRSSPLPGHLQPSPSILRRASPPQVAPGGNSSESPTLTTPWPHAPHSENAHTTEMSPDVTEAHGHPKTGGLLGKAHRLGLVLELEAKKRMVRHALGQIVGAPGWSTHHHLTFCVKLLPQRGAVLPQNRGLADSRAARHEHALQPSRHLLEKCLPMAGRTQRSQRTQ